MIDHVWQVLVLVTAALVLVLLLRRPVRRLFGAGPAFALWLLPLLLTAAPWLPLPDYVATPQWLIRAIATTTSTGTNYALTRHAAAPTFSMATWLIPVFLAIWLAGAAAGIARLCAQYARLWRHVDTLPMPLRHALRDTCPARDLSRLRMHAQGPAVLWARRTYVLLPPDFLDRFDAPARTLVLRHELTHAQRGDAWWTLAAELGRTLLWFHPLVWWALPRFRLDMELACDERTLRTSPGRHAEYGHTLMASVAARPSSTVIAWLAAPQLKARMAMISRLPPRRARRAAGLVAIGTLAAAGLLASGTVLGRLPQFAAPTNVADTWTFPPEVAPRATSPAMVLYPPTGTIKLHEFHPPDTRGLHGHGKVTLDITVDRDGHATDVTVDPRATTASPALQRLTRASALKWQFTPATKHGKPAGGMARMRLYFVLPSDEVPCKKPPSNAKLPHHCYSLDHGKGPSKARTTTSVPAANSHQTPDPTRALAQPRVMMPLLVPPTHAVAAPRAG